MKESEFAKFKDTDLVDLGIKGVGPVEKRLVEGDITSPVVYEIGLDDDYLSDYEEKLILAGGKIFMTDNDHPLYIHSEESLKILQEYQAKYSKNH